MPLPLPLSAVNLVWTLFNSEKQYAPSKFCGMCNLVKSALQIFGFVFLVRASSHKFLSDVVESLWRKKGNESGR